MIIFFFDIVTHYWDEPNDKSIHSNTVFQLIKYLKLEPQYNTFLFF